jgi:tetratricopeptide (TPR) repeat protein
LERDKKLRSYRKKDYTSLVRFPVELVDRDGIVRRYSYEESLDVYRRRMESAAWRNEDGEVIAAEIAHCFRRIEQIKRSFGIQRQVAESQSDFDGGGALGVRPVLQEALDTLLEEHALRLPQLRCRFEPVDGEPMLYQVSYGAGARHLLQRFPLDREESRAEWQAEVDALNLPRSAEGERCVWHGEAGGSLWILSGSEDIPGGLLAQAVPGEEWNPHELAPRVDSMLPDDLRNPWWLERLAEDAGESAGRGLFEEGVEALHRGEVDQAIKALEEALGASPWLRDAYLTLTALYDGAGRRSEANLMLVQAHTYLPGDPLLMHGRALVYARDGKFVEALDLAEKALGQDPDLSQARYLAALLYGALGGTRHARATLEVSGGEATSARRLRELDDWFAGHESMLRWQRRLAWSLGGAGFVCLAVPGGFAGLPMLAAGAVLALLGIGLRAAQRRAARKIIARM